MTNEELDFEIEAYDLTDEDRREMLKSELETATKIEKEDISFKDNLDVVCALRAKIVKEEAFKDCRALREIYFEDIITIESRAFEGCDNLTDVFFAVPDTNFFVDISDDAFPNNRNIHLHSPGNRSVIRYAERHGLTCDGMV